MKLEIIPAKAAIKLSIIKLFRIPRRASGFTRRDYPPRPIRFILAEWLEYSTNHNTVE